MRHALALVLLALTACAAEPVLLPDASTPDAGPCGGACGAGTVCQGGACVAVDAGTDGGSTIDAGPDVPRVDATEDRSSVDEGTDANAPDAAADLGTLDTGADASDDRPDVQPMDTPNADAPGDAGADVSRPADVVRCGDGGQNRCGSACVDSLTDPDNCGTCGARCLHGRAPHTVTQAGATGCTGGRCADVTCVAGYADCDRNGANGCEVDLATPANCGACGRRCTSCNFGVCVNL